MIFSSFEFIFVFLPITFFIYFYLNKINLTRYSLIFLACASLIFYSWWNIIYLPLILFSVITNYLIGKFITNRKFSKKIFLTLGVLFNLSLLGYFKYTDFFLSNVNVLFSTNYSMLNIALPLAISFFTFQQIAFLVDSYKGDVFQSNFLNYFVFVTFFPQLIAGPIVHHKEMMPQYSKIINKNVNYKNIYLGIFIFSVGLFKKTVIADNFSVWASIGFDSLETLRIIEAWITSLSYTFQLYFDFSGYVDMAIGVALLFNIKLPINFNSPYKSTNIREFWRRWHITLSRFLRDYLYIPFGGNKKGSARLYANLFATFIIGGLWHGAGWTFIFWGFLHAISIIIHRIWHGCGFRLNKYFAWFITFNFINITWVFFRAENWEDAIKVIRGMFGFSGVEFSNFSENFFGDIFVNFSGDSEISIWIPIAFILCLFFKNSNQIISKLGLNNKNVMFVVFILIISLMNLENNAEFIYFNF